MYICMYNVSTSLSTPLEINFMYLGNKEIYCILFHDFVLRYRGEYLGLRGTRYQGSVENFIMRSSVICTPYPLLCG
jgi:hypothetical protein